MAVGEICSFDDLYEIELPDIDSSLVMSLLEDSQVVEGADDEMLRSVIRSLEAEISNQDSYLDSSSSEGYQFSDVEQIDSYSTSPDGICFEGLDEEMMMMPYVTSDFADDIENVEEFIGVESYYEEICDYGVAMEGDEYQCGLWQ